MFDHLAMSVEDYERSVAFFTAALRPLGIRAIVSFDNDGGKVTGFGDSQPSLWIGGGGRQGGRLHLAFAALDRSAVDLFHAEALRAGGADNGPPGLRQHYHPNYYAAFVLDPDGNNIEAVCHAPAAE